VQRHRAVHFLGGEARHRAHHRQPIDERVIRLHIDATLRITASILDLMRRQPRHRRIERHAGHKARKGDDGAGQSRYGFRNVLAPRVGSGMLRQEAFQTDGHSPPPVPSRSLPKSRVCAIISCEHLGATLTKIKFQLTLRP